MGQLEILNARRPISEVLEDPEAPETVKAKLRLVIEAQAFGTASLGLPDDRQFRYYTDLGREYVSGIICHTNRLRCRSRATCYYDK